MRILAAEVADEFQVPEDRQARLWQERLMAMKNLRRHTAPDGHRDGIRAVYY